MARSSAARREAGIEITPLIDVVFLLLLFFMVSTNVVQNRSVSVELPEAQSGTTVVADALEIAIAADGAVFVNGESVQAGLGGLAQVLLGRVEARSDRQRQQIPVLIKADAIVPHQSVVTVLDVCAGLGLRRVSLATVGAASSDNAKTNRK